MGTGSASWVRTQNNFLCYRDWYPRFSSYVSLWCAGPNADAFKRTFPFEPYSIQLEFMQQLHGCIEERQFGLFESPTGTGKTLSIICGVLTWMEQHRALQRLQAAAKAASKRDQDVPGGPEEPDWLQEAADDTRASPDSTSPEVMADRQLEGPRIVYAARTHSQLSQFMGKFPFARKSIYQGTWSVGNAGQHGHDLAIYNPAASGCSARDGVHLAPMQVSSSASVRARTFRFLRWHHGKCSA